MTKTLPPSQSPDVSAAHHLLAMMFGTVQAQLIRVAAQLRIADLLKDGPQPITALAEATGIPASPLARVLRALTDLGVVEETEADQFRCTPMGELLQSDTPGSLRHYAILTGSEWIVSPWPKFLQCLQTGTSAFEHVFGSPLYTYIQQHADAAAVFNDALTSISQQEAVVVRDVYDFAAVRTVVDVGGGQGLVLATLLEIYPSLHGILLDLLPAVAGARTALHAFIASGRCQLHSGDFFRSVPVGGDVYLLKRILPAFNDTQALTLLRNCREAMSSESRILIADPDTSSLYDRLFDITMLSIFDGRLRTNTELRDLFASAGLVLTRIIPTRSTLRLAEGRPE
jgi:predicted transcriptional regulator